MFAKAFRVKSNTAIKGSDRRKLRSDVAAAFPRLSSEALSELVSNKEELNVVKVYAHKGEAITIYVRQRNPVFFEVEGRLYPTVYTLWSNPDLLPAFITWPPVLQKLIGGADLMLPGVVVPPSGLPQVLPDHLCAITLVGNRAPVAVGSVTMSTAEMLGAGMRGKGVTIFHTYSDQLWMFGDKSSPPIIAPFEESPAEGDGNEEDDQEDYTDNMSPDSCLGPSLENLHLRVEGTASASAQYNDMVNTALTEDVKLDGEDPVRTVETEDHRTPQEKMDELLHQCFFHALKCKVKKDDLPLLTSTFLRNHLFACCPQGQQIDIKKSSYKKLSKFLHCMQQRKVLQVKELTKGVESIVDIDWKHHDIRSFVVPDMESAGTDSSESKDGSGDPTFQPPEIIPLYGVSQRVAPLFKESGHRKGDYLSASDVRSIVISYVKNNELVDEVNRNLVTVDPILCDCLLERSEHHEVTKLKWDDLITRCLERMQASHQVKFPGQAPIVRKGNLDPIDITVAQRSSNKKVTMIKNLELYGLDPHALATLLQQRVQASATVHALPGSKDRVQVQIQGNQVHHLGKMLLDEYHIPRKFIQGLDKAAKPGKKN
ncbi:eukaryotic translation initiation factor 2D isoform X1 [Pleurodeles waltl]|uniref:eukaryotic translation initiation factor 2D isoform X1 n=1 Tax=Pleurodeles waltl TaxID=8319 RepID=UPI003709860B